MPKPTSELGAGMKDAEAYIRAERQALINSKSRITTADTAIGNFETFFADLFTDIDALPGAGNSFNGALKDQKTALIAEATALKAKSATAVSDLGPIDFTT